MNLAILQAKCEIKKFLLNLVIKYEHSKYIVGKPNVVESFVFKDDNIVYKDDSIGRFNYGNEIKFDDDINIDFDKETRAVNILKEKTNERRKMKSEKFKIVTPNDVDCVLITAFCDSDDNRCTKSENWNTRRL
ncbi:hypothetical protein H8356DRAFT_1344486 [Neocallimastix lanati (nom. inval.)]|nr:hypothetical protein H8356DRAFT_1344486 [Neocallimastix sp. JGI-2020a]